MQLQIFNNPDFGDVLASLDADEKAKFNLGRSPIHGGGGEANIINESALSRLDDDEKGTHNLPTLGDKQNMSIVDVLNGKAA